MKQLTGLFFVALFAFCCSSKKSDLSELSKSDLEAANLKGKVWKIQKTIHTVGDNCKCPAAEKDECNQASYVYNEKGNLIESCDIDNNGNIDFTYKYIYDKHDLCVEIDKFSGDILRGKEVNTIQGGKIMEIKTINEAGRMINLYKYKYAGNELSEGKILNKSGNVLTTFHNDYVNEQLTSRTVKDSLGNVLNITKYNWNSNNDKMETITSIPNDNSEYKIIFEYEYDNEGNWIKQTQLFNGEIVKIVMRVITYYDNNNEMVSL
jgi:hypothetical protein